MVRSVQLALNIDTTGCGCADGTQDTIVQALEGIPGQLHSHEFVDFSTTRNWALRVGTLASQ